MMQQQKMGMLFLAATACMAFQISGLSYAGQILLPEDPVPIQPRSRGEAGAREDYERKKKHLDKTLKRQTPTPPSASTIRDRQLLEESIKPTPLEFGMTVSLLYNMVRTAGDKRKNYTAEPSAHLAVFYRPIKSADSSQLNMWLGARAYFVGGQGSYNGVPGRYSFSYYGPMLGLGKFDRAPASLGREEAVNPATALPSLVGRNGYFALLGVAAQTRQSTREIGTPSPEEDMDNEPVAFDSPGIWAEVWYANLRYNAISLQTFAGIQSGNEKYFVYLGIGVGGWR